MGEADTAAAARSHEDTIFALSSAPGRAAIAVIRISGRAARETVADFAGYADPAPRRAVRVTLRDPASGEALDDGLMLWFPGPASYSGEDIAEFHVHGGRAVTAAVIDALAARPGLRPAEPGEFTRRAFENGRLDLTAVEGIADLVDAETEAQRRQALRQAGGALAVLYDEWRDRLTRAVAWFEAQIDFPDEELPENIMEKVGLEVDDLVSAMEIHLRDERRGERLRDGLYVTIVGAPNAGKSSLLNRLARREAAIVSSTAGTTRDVIEVHMDLAGYPVTVADTAGLRAVDAGGLEDAIEAEGVRRALARAAAADLKVAVFAADRPPDAATRAQVDENTVVAVNKIDLAPPPPTESFGAGAVIPVSARTGQGVEALVEWLAGEGEGRLAVGPAPAITRARHRRALEACVEALRRSRAAYLPELVAEDLRLAIRALGQITGQVDIEDLLDVIFRDFCIGK